MSHVEITIGTGVDSAMIQQSINVDDIGIGVSQNIGFKTGTPYDLYDGIGQVLFDIADYELGGLSKTNFVESFEIKELGEIEEGYYDSESVEGRDDVFGVGKISIKLTVLNTDNAVRFVALMWCTEAIKKIKIYNNAGKRIFHGFLSQDAVSANANNQEITLNFTSAHLHDVYFKNEVFYVDDNGNRQSKTVLNADLIDEIFGAGQSNWDKTSPSLEGPDLDFRGGFYKLSSWMRVRYVLEQLLKYFGGVNIDFGDFDGIWNSIDLLHWIDEPVPYFFPSIAFVDIGIGVEVSTSKNELFDRLLFAKNWIFGLSNEMQIDTLLNMLAAVANWCGASVGIDGRGNGYVRPIFKIQSSDIIDIAGNDVYEFVQETQNVKRNKGIILAGYASEVDKNTGSGKYPSGHYFSTNTVRGDVNWYGKGDGTSLYALDSLYNAKTDVDDNAEYRIYKVPYTIDHNMQTAYHGGYAYKMNLFVGITRSDYVENPITGLTINWVDLNYHNRGDDFNDLWFVKPTSSSNIADLIWHEKSKRRATFKVRMKGINYHYPKGFRIFNRLLRPISFKKNITVPGGETEMIAVDITN